MTYFLIWLRILDEILVILACTQKLCGVVDTAEFGFSLVIDTAEFGFRGVIDAAEFGKSHSRYGVWF